MNKSDILAYIVYKNVITDRYGKAIKIVFLKSSGVVLFYFFIATSRQAKTALCRSIQDCISNINVARVVRGLHENPEWRKDLTCTALALSYMAECKAYIKEERKKHSKLRR
jgi:hypothetical protein